MTNTDRDLSKLTLKELSDELDALRHTPDICALEQELMRREEALPGGPDIRIRHHEHRGPHTTVVAFEVTGANEFFRNQVANYILEAAANVAEGDVPVELPPSQEQH
jgi:hypothetical protein